MAPVRALGVVCAVAATTLAAVPATATATDRPTPSREHAAAGQQDKRAAARERADRMRVSLVRVALAKKGARYVGGGSGPWAFDCSGFTMWVYKQATGKRLPHFSGAQMNRAKRVSRNNLRPGDLLFYGPGGSQHVSMYIGRGRMIHATNPRSGVRVDRITMGYYASRFAGAGRIIGG